MNKIINMIDLILNELKPYLYDYEYHHLEDIKNNVMIYLINDSIDKINLIDINNQYISDVNIKPYNQMIDIPPITYHNIKPILLIREDASIVQIIHEICHLLSIGSYQNYYHTLGINEYIYDKQYQCIDKYEHYYINEWMNDLMTSYFMKTIYHEDFHYQEMDKLSEYIKVDMHQLIHWYFSGHVMEMREILGDYDALYQQIIS